jgi:hypothetical protein
VQNMRGLPKSKRRRGDWRTVPDAVSATTPRESRVGSSEAGRDEEILVDPGTSGMTRAAKGHGYDGGGESMSGRNPGRRENPQDDSSHMAEREMSNHFLPLLRPGGTVHISRNNPTDLWRNA